VTKPAARGAGEERDVRSALHGTPESDVSEPTVIEDGVIVLFEYTLSLPDGEVIESCAGEGPIPYLHGAGNIVVGLEKQMAGKAVGDTFRAIVAPEEAYGEHDGEDPEPVPLDELPDDIEEGTPVLAELADGTEVELWIVEIGDEHALLSQNHPLAGVTLTFDVAIKGMRAPTEAELEHGHPHGVDGTEENDWDDEDDWEE
jgi:FKBP-type peptidyl-prolyl cis-trans isomerase SlyD